MLGVIECHMEIRASKKQEKRMSRVWCFIAAVVLTSLGTWLCILGDLPAIKISDNSYMIFGGMSINGVDVPAWAFYFIPAGLFVVATVFLFVGWRMNRVIGHEDT
jgi:hypothetical protein